MPGETETNNQLGFGTPSPLARVERAAYELRCGRPVFVLDSTDRAAVILATEMATEAKVLALADLVGGQMPHVVLTHHRAETLKIRLYTPEVVRIPYPGLA